MVLRKSLFVLLIAVSFSTFSQENNNGKYTLIGTVVDGASNNVLSGTNITTSNNLGTKTNELGEFSIHTQTDDTLKISYVGYKTLTYIAPEKKPGKYLIKFRMYKDSVSLREVEIFPYPTFKEFKEAFLAQDKTDEQIEIKGVKTYVDRDVSYEKPSVFSPASFIYDRLFDKKAKTRRKLNRRKEKVKESMQIEE